MSETATARNAAPQTRGSTKSLGRVRGLGAAVVAALTLAGPAGAASAAPPVTVERTPDQVVLANGYVRAAFDLRHPQLAALQADFQGNGNYGANQTTGIVLARTDAAEHASSAGAAPGLAASVLESGPDQARVQIDGVADDVSNPLVTSTWTLALASGSRALELAVDAHALRAAPVRAVRLAYALRPTSVYGLFDRGATQRMASDAPYFASADHLQRFYALGGGGAVDVTAGGQRQTVLVNRPGAPASGLEQVLAGSYPRLDAWDGGGWSAAGNVNIAAGDAWRVTARIAPNNYDFPAGVVPDGANMRFDDLRALLTGVYGTAAGTLDTYALPGEAAPSLAAPTRWYGDGRNFYDPDTWLIDTALLYSGDSYLEQQARTLIEKSGAAMSASGQIPHHFNGATPTYTALSGATQTGPNIFWIAAALQYVKATGDYGWLRAQMPTIERALGFLTDRYDPAVKLVNAPGPLWIDVFIRQNYTADTNAFMVELLRQVADAEALLGDDALAGRRRAMADDIVAGMNERLWAGDHYVTQLNPDGSTRDFVDYDANLLAVGFGVAPPDRAQKVLARVDSGGCAHGRPTWVSERAYGAGDTYGGNTGDSAVTMGRIGWADAQARRRVGDRQTFESKILGPVESDLLARTWLTERYDCAGNATRAPNYYEYPSLVAMLLRETAYGIDVGLQDVVIAPFTRSDFRYHLGSVDVSYGADAVSLKLPGSGVKRYTITGLHAGATYAITVTGENAQAPTTAVAGADGLLRFSAPIGPATTVTAALPGGAAGGAGSAGGGPNARPDRRAPKLRVSARKRQVARRYLRAAVTCDEGCAATLRARALKRRAGSTRRKLAAKRRVTVRIKLTRKFRSARHRALRRHRSVPLTLRVRAADAAGNATTVAVKIRLVRRRVAHRRR